MDPEQTFLRVHARLSGVLARLLTPKFRTVLEYLCLFNALVLLVLLVVMHVNFVAQPACASEFSGAHIDEAHLIQVKITGSSRVFEEHQQAEGLNSWKFWFRERSSSKVKPGLEFEAPAGIDSPRAPAAAHSQAQGEEALSGPSSQAADVVDHFSSGPLGAALLHYLGRWSGYSASCLKSLEQSIRSFAQVWRLAGWESYATSPKNDRRAVAWIKFDSLDSLIVDRVETLGKMHDPMYLYSVEKGYLILTEIAKVQHQIRTVNVSICAQNACFGNRWQRFLIDNFVGYDTILMNSLLSARGKGYLYNFQTKELHNLNYLQETSGVSYGLEDYVVFKLGVLIMSLFVFFTTTMSVSFTLRETQARMLKFTVQLQHHARHRLPTFHLIFIHVFESLVFVPIMIGILFFLFEFFDDQLLAFMVLTLVWLCELFTMISVRTRISMQYFPRFFFLYFMIFHIYFFSYTYGFSYLAFSATAAFMQHLVLFFWNRFEVPALQQYLRRRALLQQQGLHVTSSTFLTSAVQLTRLNTTSNPQAGSAGDSHRRRGGGASSDNNNNSNNSTINNSSRSNNSTQTSLGFVTGTFEVTETPEPSDSRSLDPGQANVNNTGSRILAPGSLEASSLAAAPGSEGAPEDVPNIQVAPITAFGSVFPWTLGSPSTALVSFLPIFRELRDADSSASSSSEGLRQRHGASAAVAPENQESSGNPGGDSG